MMAELFFAGESREISCEETENSLWRAVAEEVFKETFPYPAFVEISCEYGDAAIQILSACEKGKVSPYKQYQIEYNFIYLPKEAYDEVILERDCELVSIKVGQDIAVGEEVMDSFRYYLELFSYMNRGYSCKTTKQDKRVSDKEMLSKDLSLYCQDNGKIADNVSVTLITEYDTDLSSVLSEMLFGKVNRVFEIRNRKCDEAFHSYCANRGVTTTKLFVHGSRNENWISILNSGLTSLGLVKNGRAYGNGIYLSKDGNVSRGFSNIRNFNFESGVTKRRYLAICEVAYEKVVAGSVPNEDLAFLADCYEISDIVVVPNDNALHIKYLIEIFD